MIDEIAAASATVKFGSAVIAAAAALTVSAKGPAAGAGNGGFPCGNCTADVSM
jgi:hypothetical protein